MIVLFFRNIPRSQKLHKNQIGLDHTRLNNHPGQQTCVLPRALQRQKFATLIPCVVFISNLYIAFHIIHIIQSISYDPPESSFWVKPGTQMMPSLTPVPDHDQSVLILRIKKYFQPYKCLFALIIMATYWTAEVTPLAVTSLIPMFMFPMLGILPAARTSAHYFKVSIKIS